MYKFDLEEPNQKLKPEYHELCHKNWEIKRDHQSTSSEPVDLVDKFGTKLSDFTEHMEQLIDEGYGYLLYLDRVASAIYNTQLDTTQYDQIIPIGYKDSSGKYYLYNHMDFKVTLNQQDSKYHVVGFQVEPKSLHYNSERLKVLNFDSRDFSEKKFNEYNTTLQQYV